MHRPWLYLILLPWVAAAATHSGTVRSGGHPIPGATVTATLNGKTLTAVTNESGTYTFQSIDPGTWQIQVQIFGFSPAKGEVTVAEGGGSKDWTVEVRQRPAQRQLPGGMRNGQGANGGFQNVELAQSAAAAELAATPPVAEPAGTSDANESFLVTGSISQGLQEANNRDFLFGPPMGGMGGPGGPGGNPSIFGGNQEGAQTGGPGGGFGGRGGFGGGPGGGGFGGPRGGGFGGGPGGPGRQRGMRGEGVPPGTIFGNRMNRGRNQLRGMAYYSFRNSALDAKPFSITGAEQSKPSYAQNRFGVNVGGALRIPKLLKGDRTFFFLNVTGTLGKNPFDQLATVPTALERAGDFSQSLLSGQPFTIYDPLSSAPFSGNVIPASRVSSVSTGLLRFIPPPNQVGLQNYRYVTSIARNQQEVQMRINQTLTRKDRVDGNFNLRHNDGQAAQVFGFLDDQTGNGWSVATGYTHNFSPRLLTNVRWNFSRNRNQTLPFFAYGANVAAALGILGTSADPINYGPPNLSFTNFGALSDASASLQRNQTSSLNNGWTIVRGQHTVTMGGEYRRMQLNPTTDQNGRGTLTYSGLATSGFDTRGLPLPQTGFDFADFLLGAPQSASIRYGSSSNYFRGTVYSFYGQDDWKVLPNFTVNTGLRYEYTSPFYEKYDRIANLDVKAGFTGVSVATPNQPGAYTGAFPRGLIEPDRNNWAPRIGIAWRPKSKNQVIVRAGYGIYYNGSIYSQFVTRLASQPPFATSNSITTSLASPLNTATAFTQTASQTILNTYAIDRYYKVGYAQTWNFSIQRNLPLNLVIDTGYLATKGTRLDIERQPNRATPGSPLTAEERRQIGNAVGFTYESAEGNSILHSGFLRLSRRFRHGFSGSISYTLAKSIDNASTFGGGGATVAQNDKDLSLERGLSSFDRRHTFSANYMFSSPSQGNRLLKDWTLNGGVTANSGTPLTARVLGNQSNSGGSGAIGSGRADATGLSIGGGSGPFNLAAFTIPPSNRFGNAGRNTIPGPGLFSMNLGVGRSFRLGNDGRRRLEFHVDATNFTNHVNFTSYGTVVNALNYGLVTAAGQMRTISSSLRFRF